MSPRTLIRHRPGTILGFRKNGQPIFPIAGGSEPLTAEQQAAADAAKTAADAAKNTEPVEATDETGVGLGFPKDTAVADMKIEEQAAYWRNQSKVQQKKVPANLTELQTAAQKWEEYQRTQQTPAEQQLAEVRDQTTAQVREQVAKEAAVELLRVSLHTRGKDTAEIDELVKFINPEAFLNAEKKMDIAAVTSYLDKVAPSGQGGGGGGLPGQGRYSQTPADKAAAGRAEAERRGFKPADRSSSSLIPR